MTNPGAVGAARPHWDEELTTGMVKSLSPRDRGMRTVTSLTRKVQVLERWAREGVPSDAAVPTNRTKLREWADAELRLWPWSDPQVDHPSGRNAALTASFRRALAAIATRRKRSASHLRQEIEAKDRIIASLERQNLDLLDQVRRLQKRVVQPPLNRR